MWRKPGVLMTAYVALFVVAEVWATSGPVPHQLLPDLGSPFIAAFLAWRVANGGSLSRGLIIVYTAFVIQTLLWSSDMKSGGLASIGLMAICLIQIGLLVSTPVYERTRDDWADRPANSARLWPAPRWWMAAVAVAAGLVVTLLFLGSEDVHSVPCALPPSAPAAQCVTVAQGFPVHFLAAIPAGSEAFPVIYKGAAAEDLAIWTVLSFATCYLIWLPSRRPDEVTVARVKVPV